jgi:ribosomal protein S17E
MITAKYAQELVKEFEQNKDMILEEIFMSATECISKQIKTVAGIGRRKLVHETDQTFVVGPLKDYFTGLGFTVKVEESDVIFEGKTITIEW